jgi:thioredoxin-like negative regulator of GroEL
MLLFRARPRQSWPSVRWLRFVSAGALLTVVAVTCGTSCSKTTGQSTPELSPSAVESRVDELLSAGRQAEAEALLRQYAEPYRTNQRIMFLRACCSRSRFQVDRSFPLFAAVANMDADTVSGRCAWHIMHLDGQRDIDEHSASLRRLTDENPDDTMVRWMAAVQCRTFDRNEEGVEHYKKILEKWDPGPSLVHQTYANLLSELKRYEDALVERRMAVELEPAG